MYSIRKERLVNEPFAWATGVFNDEEIDLIIRLGQEQPLINAGVNNTGIASLDTRRSKINWIKPTVATEFIFRRLGEVINRLNNDFYQYELTEMEDLQFSEYDSSYQGMYTDHTDDGFEGYGRKLSFSLQLSDETAYEGGDLLFYRFKRDSSLQAPKQKGSIIIFPSWTIHEVTPVTVGTRHSLVGWVHGPNFR